MSVSQRFIIVVVDILIVFGCSLQETVSSFFSSVVVINANAIIRNYVVTFVTIICKPLVLFAVARLALRSSDF